MTPPTTSPTLEDFETFLDMKVKAARKVDGPSIANQDQWGDPRTDPKWADATWATRTHLTMWNNVVSSEDFAPWSPVVVFEAASGIGESLEVAVANLIRRWSSLPRDRGRPLKPSNLPSWEAFSRKGTLARACFFFIQNMSFGASLHNAMTSRRFVALRDMVASPNRLPPMLIPMSPARPDAGTPTSYPKPNTLKRKADGEEVGHTRETTQASMPCLVSCNTMSPDRRAHEEWRREQCRLIDKILADSSTEEGNTKENQRPDAVDMSFVKTLIDDKTQILETRVAAQLRQMETRIRAETRAVCHAIIGNCTERIRHLEERHNTELCRLAAKIDQLGAESSAPFGTSDGKLIGGEHIKLESIETD